MTENWEDPEEQEARDIEEHLKDDDPQLDRFMSKSAVPWIITRAAVGTLITIGGFAVLAYGSDSLGIGALILGIALVFIGGYETAMRLMQLRQRIREG
ncbi:MAG TPA: DUF3040 domain-containing protein [Streptosporangiaceae bacterium]